MKLDTKNGLSLEGEIQIEICKGVDKSGDKIMKNKNSISS